MRQDFVQLDLEIKSFLETKISAPRPNAPQPNPRASRCAGNRTTKKAAQKAACEHSGLRQALAGLTFASSFFRLT